MRWQGHGHALAAQNRARSLLRCHIIGGGFGVPRLKIVVMDERVLNRPRFEALQRNFGFHRLGSVTIDSKKGDRTAVGIMHRSDIEPRHVIGGGGRIGRHFNCQAQRRAAAVF